MNIHDKLRMGWGSTDFVVPCHLSTAQGVANALDQLGILRKIDAVASSVAWLVMFLAGKTGANYTRKMPMYSRFALSLFVSLYVCDFSVNTSKHGTCKYIPLPCISFTQNKQMMSETKPGS